MIYTIIDTVEEKYCKIGYSTDPIGRLQGIQIGMPLELSIKYVVEGKLKDEKLLHKKFKSHRIRGEWFLFCKEIKEYMKSLPQIELYKSNVQKKPKLKSFDYNSVNPLTEEMYINRNLPESAQELVRYIKNNKKDDIVWIRAENVQMGYSTYYRSLSTLIENGVIVKANYKDKFYINPAVM